MKLLRRDSNIKFSKFVVAYCMFTAPLFTTAVMYFNWYGKTVQTEIIVFFGAGFLGHLFSLAWVTVTERKCSCNGQNGHNSNVGEPYELNQNPTADCRGSSR